MACEMVHGNNRHHDAKAEARTINADKEAKE
jgi:hypothetical protein